MGILGELLFNALSLAEFGGERKTPAFGEIAKSFDKHLAK